MVLEVAKASRNGINKQTNRSEYFFFSRRRKELDAEKAPQILRIDHDAAVDVGSSDEESVDSDLEDAASLQQSPYTYGQSERQPSADSASRYKATGSAKGM